MCRAFAIEHLERAVGIDPAPVRRLDPQKYNAFWRRIMGDQWESGLDSQLVEFARMIDFLRDHGVHVGVVLFPLPSWEDNLPFEARYNLEMTALCRLKDVALYDWSRKLADDDFGDDVHVNASGAEKTHRALLDLAAPHLRRIGELP
jgi:hypothetical protein